MLTHDVMIQIYPIIRRLFNHNVGGTSIVLAGINNHVTMTCGPVNMSGVSHFTDG